MLSRVVLAALAAALLMTGFATPAEARWLRAESRKFIVFSNGDDMTLRAFVNNLEDFDTILRDQTQVPQDREPSRKLEIYLVRDEEELKVVGPDVGGNVQGFYSASMYDIFALAIRSKANDDWNDDVVYHEYSHHFMLHYLPGRYPGWLTEGFAEYFATISMKDNLFETGRIHPGRAYALLNEKWLPMEELFTLRSTEIPGKLRGAYYAQAWLLTHYMMADPARRQQLSAYVNGMVAGRPSVEAWTQATGDDMASLTLKLQAYKKSNLISTRWTRKARRPSAAMTVTTLPAAADDLLLLGQRLKGLDSNEDDAALLALVRVQAAKHPGDRFAQLQLARAEFTLGEFERGEALIMALLDRDPEDASALQMMGIALVDRARDEGDNEEKLLASASKYLARAYQVDNDDYRTLVYFTLTQQIQRDYPNANTLEILTEAFVRAPQVAEVRLLLARGLMRKKRWEDATFLLNPLANDPHGGGGAETAKGLLRQIAAAR